MTLDGKGEPIYGLRDSPDLEQIRALGLPFWMAGSYGGEDRLQHALSVGASGIQVGTAFAFCEESGLPAEMKASVVAASREGRVSVFTDPLASPTGFPFKVMQVEGTVSEPGVFAARTRICDLGYLRQSYRQEDGTLGYRCPAEPVEDYLDKGGAEADVHGRKCLCNGLLSAVEYGQVRHNGDLEPSIYTAGDEATVVHKFLRPGRTAYTADDVIDQLLGLQPA
jgi:nitronate monooxygenase